MTEIALCEPEPHVKYVEFRIEKFLYLSSLNDVSLESPRFIFSGAKWCLQIYPNGRTYKNSMGWVSIYLSRDYVIKQHTVIFRIGILKNDGSELKSLENKRTFAIECSWGFGNFIERSKLLCSNDVLTRDGTITIFCHLRVQEEPLQLPTREYVPGTYSTEGTMTLLEGLKELYISKSHTDVTITVKSREFQAHRIVLCARSKVFAAMFEHDTAEKNSGTIEITDCDPDSFEQFLFFLYSGKFNIVTCDNVMSLYKIADKYDVRELKKECIQRMIYQLSVDTFCDVLQLPAIANEAELMRSITKFFIDNSQSIMATTKWHEYLQEHPLVANELFTNLKL